MIQWYQPNFSASGPEERRVELILHHIFLKHFTDMGVEIEPIGAAYLPIRAGHVFVHTYMLQSLLSLQGRNETEMEAR